LFNHARIRAQTRTSCRKPTNEASDTQIVSNFSQIPATIPRLVETYCHRRAVIAKKAAPNAAITGTKALRVTSEEAEVVPPLPDEELPDAEAPDPVTLDPVVDGSVEGADPMIRASVAALSMVRPDE
jgi:hypothetical protein